MAVSVKSFLVLEESLTDRLSASWARKAAPVINKIIRAVNKQDFTTAYELVDDLNMAGIIPQNDKFIQTAGMASILFGASQFGSPRNSEVAKMGKPPEVEQSTELMERSLATDGTNQVRQRARKLIAEEEERQKEIEQQVAKAASAAFTKGFKSFVRDSGEAAINITSSLHTSRLAQWGFTTEAEILGVTSYQVSEILDSRTCPVCREMDGKIFPVAPARAKLERWLSVDDPQDLKTVAPWPKQDAASIASLKRMSTADLIGAGYDTPPYHPRCRGVLVATTSPASVEVAIPPPAALDILDQVEEAAAIEAATAAAVTTNVSPTFTDQLAGILGVGVVADIGDDINPDEDL